MSAAHLVSQLGKFNAESVVEKLLAEEEDPKDWLTSREEDWEKFPLHDRIGSIPGAVRRSGADYEDQWDIQYNIGHKISRSDARELLNTFKACSKKVK